MMQAVAELTVSVLKLYLDLLNIRLYNIFIGNGENSSLVFLKWNGESSSKYY